MAGPRHQGEAILRFVERIRQDNGDWLDGFSMYQFRDRGRLGLELEDPNHSAVGITQPIMEDYKKILKDPLFLPGLKEEEELTLPAKLRWGGSEDADGIALPLVFDQTPEFCEITFEEELNLMMELNGRWFYKAPETKTIDLMPAFFETPIEPGTKLSLKIFAPPASGENDPSQGEDWMSNYYCTMTKMPELRIRYEPVQEIG